MGSIDLSSVRSCWGNSNFDYVHSDSVGNSGGILCIWDPNSFRRSSFTRSDYFVIVRGVWLKSGIDLMIVVVYAPQEAKEKRMLWDYLAHVSNQWVGKLVMMGDFNEVRYKSDRYGSNFNAHDAEIFNSFIYNAGLDEVPLGGSAYTWCLKSASKMSKLDRFFVSENLLSMCPNITAITLERFISDHRPILLREVRYDYGPIPFRFYRYWLEVDGFDKLVRDSWNVAPVNKKNAIRNFMGKLKFLKDRIRSWLSIHRSNSRGEIYFLKEELRSCDEVIDKGDCSNEVVHKRTEILNKIHQVNNIQASEIAQKAKIKWAIEGDENVKFFHGMLNKKRNQSNIRGIMVNGTWVDDPVQVKTRFRKRIWGMHGFPKEEVKRVVWGLTALDKSSGSRMVFHLAFTSTFLACDLRRSVRTGDYLFMYGESNELDVLRNPVDFVFPDSLLLFGPILLPTYRPKCDVLIIGLLFESVRLRGRRGRKKDQESLGSDEESHLGLIDLLLQKWCRVLLPGPSIPGFGPEKFLLFILRAVIELDKIAVRALDCDTGPLQKSCGAYVLNSLMSCLHSVVASEHNEEMVNAEVDGSDPKMTDDTIIAKFGHAFMQGMLVILDDIVELAGVGSGRVSSDLNDVVVSLFVGEEGDGLAPSSVAGEGAAVDPSRV
ncbi:RNA-directed DNA polymerase, eukaryota [Tanacetum coccineum]